MGDSVAEASREGDDVAKSAEDDTFFELLASGNSGTYLGLTALEMEAKSDFIAVGRMVDLQEGMIQRTSSYDLPTMVIYLEVRTLDKGEAKDGRAHFEVIRLGAPLATYRAHLPDEDVMVFLMPADLPDLEGLEYVDPGKGYPEGTEQRWLVNPQGMLREVNGKIVHPLAPEFPLFQRATTFADVIARI